MATVWSFRQGAVEVFFVYVTSRCLKMRWLALLSGAIEKKNPVLGVRCKYERSVVIGNVLLIASCHDIRCRLGSDAVVDANCRMQDAQKLDTSRKSDHDGDDQRYENGSSGSTLARC